MTTPDLDPSEFEWYVDPDHEVLVGCFALGTGAGEPQLASLGRQLAEDFAEILRLHTAFVTVPQFLTIDRSTVDLEGSTRVRSAFAVFHSLPETRIVRTAARRIGARFALTGRLLGEGTDYLFGANIVDVERTTILGCAQVQIPRDGLLDALVDISAHLLQRFATHDSETLVASIRSILGTDSYRAWYNLAIARDMERRDLTGVAKLNPRRLAERYALALENDPGYVQPVERLTQLFAADPSEDMLRTMDRTLGRVPLRQAAVGLLRAQALIKLGDIDEARLVLEAVTDTHGHVAQGWFLRGELEAGHRPTIAMNCYRQAHLIDPHRALYKRKADGESL